VSPEVLALWARTRIHVWPETYLLVSLPLAELPAAAALAAGQGPFGALVVERDEVSVTVREDLWRASPLRASARAESAPLRALSLDLDIDLSVCGYLAPAAERLAQAGVSIVPQCAFLKDHLLVHQDQLAAAQRVLEDLVRECGGVGSRPA